MPTFTKMQAAALRGRGLSESAIAEMERAGDPVANPSTEEANAPADMWGFEGVKSLITEANRRDPDAVAGDPLGFGEKLDEAGEQRIGRRMTLESELVEDEDGILRDREGHAAFSFDGVVGVDPDARPQAPAPVDTPKMGVGWFIDPDGGGLRATGTGKPMIDCRKVLGLEDAPGDEVPAWYRAQRRGGYDGDDAA